MEKYIATVNDGNGYEFKVLYNDGKLISNDEEEIYDFCQEAMPTDKELVETVYALYNQNYDIVGCIEYKED